MSTVQPSALPLITAQSAGIVLSPLTVTDTGSAAALAVLEQGAVVDAQVQAKDASGQVTVTTDTAGVLTLQAKGAAADLLTAGAKVALQVITIADGQLALRVLSVDDQAVARPLNLPTSLDLPESIPAPLVGGSVVSTTPQQPAQPPGLIATVIRPATMLVESPSGSSNSPEVGAPLLSPPAGKDGGLPTNLPVGTTVTVRILDVSTGSTPSSPTTPSAGTSPTLGPVGAMPSPIAPSSIPLTPSSSPPTLGQPPAEKSLPNLAGASDPPSPDSPQPAVLEGKVVTAVSGQRAIVSTPIGLLSLPSVSALKANADVKLEVISPPTIPEDVPLAADQPASPMKALNDGLAALANTGDAQVLQKVMSVIPQLDGRLAATMAVVLKAMDRQSGRTLVDKEAIDGLVKAGRKDVAERISGALRQLEESATEHVGQEGNWRGFTVPLHTDAMIEPVQFFIRQPPQENGRVDPDGDQSGSGGIGKNRDQRFLVEIMLSRMGRLQMDGLVQRMDKRFDLIVRTQQPLAKDMRNDITDLFITTTEAAGSRGSVTFQSGGRFVSVMQAVGATKMSV